MKKRQAYIRCGQETSDGGGRLTQTSCQSYSRRIRLIDHVCLGPVEYFSRRMWRSKGSTLQGSNAIFGVHWGTTRIQVNSRGSASILRYLLQVYIARHNDEFNDNAVH